jgi:hypothetical protein
MSTFCFPAIFKNPEKSQAGCGPARSLFQLLPRPFRAQDSGHGHNPGQRAIGYSFDKASIKMGAYSPQGYLDYQVQDQETRKLWLEILKGERPIPMKAFQQPAPPSTAVAPPSTAVAPPSQK